MPPANMNIVAKSPWTAQITASGNSIRTTEAFRKRSGSVGPNPITGRQGHSLSVRTGWQVFSSTLSTVVP